MYLDDRLHELLKSLPPLPVAKLLQAPAAVRNAARKDFFKDGKLPRFVYPKTDTVDLETFFSQARVVRSSIKSENSAATLKKFYLDKLTELETRAKLIAAARQGNDKRVSQLSLELFGTPSTNLKDFDKEFTERLNRARAGETHVHPKNINAAQFTKLLERALKHYCVINWKIKLSPRKRLQCSHNHKTSSIVFRVPKKLSISRERARRLIAHEIEVHALRRLNGANSQLHILKRGLAGYVKTEEGLALYHQHQHDAPRKHAPGFWDAWSTALVYKLGFAGAYNRLLKAQQEILQAQDDERAERHARLKAWNLCLRSSKGITQPGKPGIGYFKDHIYRQGYEEVAAAVKKHGADKTLPQLFVGKVGLNDLPALKKLGLKPGRLPDNIGKQIASDN